MANLLHPLLFPFLSSVFFTFVFSVKAHVFCHSLDWNRDICICFPCSALSALLCLTMVRTTSSCKSVRVFSPNKCSLHHVTNFRTFWFRTRSVRHNWHLLAFDMRGSGEQTGWWPLGHHQRSPLLPLTSLSVPPSVSGTAGLLSNKASVRTF